MREGARYAATWSMTSNWVHMRKKCRNIVLAFCSYLGCENQGYQGFEILENALNVCWRLLLLTRSCGGTSWIYFCLGPNHQVAGMGCQLEAEMMSTGRQLDAQSESNLHLDSGLFFHFTFLSGYPRAHMLPVLDISWSRQIVNQVAKRLRIVGWRGGKIWRKAPFRSIVWHGEVPANFLKKSQQDYKPDDPQIAANFDSFLQRAGRLWAKSTKGTTGQGLPTWQN